MNFRPFAVAVAARLETLKQRELYVVDVGDLFETYLAAFPEGTNPIFRKRTEHDCSCCKNFIRNFGKVVGLENGVVKTLWEGLDLAYPYNEVASRLDEIVRQQPIAGIFSPKERQYGQEYNYDTETNVRWDHFCGKTDNFHTLNPEAVRGEAAATVHVFQRGLREIARDAIETVVDLIEGNALYRGAEFKAEVLAFRALQTAYIGSHNPSTFAWEHFRARGSRIKNSVIGTLLIDLSSGTDVSDAVRMFESKVAPLNYKRPTALITPRMIEAAVKTIADLGLEPALDRRYAKLSDVSVNNVLFVDNSVRGSMKHGLTALLTEEVKPTAVNISGAETISPEEFLSEVLPKATSIEVLLENRHLGNFVSLTAPVNEDSKRLFRWNNDFAWSYDGDATDSIKQRVKRAGGNVEAKLRVSLAWFNFDDLDIHVQLPNGEHIYFGNKGNILDVDMNAGWSQSREPVENLSWNGRIPNGIYTVYVNQFCRRESIDVGFTLELEYAGKLQQFAYAKALRDKETVTCFKLEVVGGELLAVQVAPGLTPGSTAQEKWGLTTGGLIRTEVLMASPNHWDTQSVGNKHWFFFLKNCVNPSQTRGIYNEFLSPGLEQHRKVFEILGAKTKCPASGTQLSGLGFSSGRNDSVTVLSKGPKLSKAYNIMF